MDSVTQPVLRFAGDRKVWFAGDVHCTEEPEEILLFPQIAAQSVRQIGPAYLISGVRSV